MKKKFKKTFIFITCVIGSFLLNQSYAQESDTTHSKNDKGSEPKMIDGLSERLVIDKNENMTYPRTAFLFGVYKEYLTPPTHANFSNTGLGVSLGFEQNITGYWNGGLEARWSNWSSQVADTSPLSFFSKVSYVPNFGYLIGYPLGNIVRPYLTSGLGYSVFFDKEAWISTRSKTNIGQVAITYGGGIKFTWPKSLAVKVGLEWWRGVQTSDYQAQIVMVQLMFGDVDHL